jgi:hypothetical protein
MLLYVSAVPVQLSVQMQTTLSPDLRTTPQLLYTTTPHLVSLLPRAAKIKIKLKFKKIKIINDNLNIIDRHNADLVV